MFKLIKRFALLCVVAVALAALWSRGDERPVPAPPAVPMAPAAPPEVSAWLSQHPEFGRPVAVEPLPDWAKGKRHGVRYDNGRWLVLYLKDGKVTAAHEKSGAGPLVWGEYEHDAPPPTEQPVAEPPPAEQPVAEPETPEDKTRAERARLIEKRRARRAASPRK